MTDIWSDVNKSLEAEHDVGDPLKVWKLHAAVDKTLDDLNHPEAKALREAWANVSEGIGQEQPQALAMIDGKLIFQ